MAALATLLASDEAAYITGTELNIDGSCWRDPPQPWDRTGIKTANVGFLAGDSGVLTDRFWPRLA